MKKKVLFIITKGNFGGAQKYVYDLATGLPKTKYEAVVAMGEGELLKERLEEGKIRTIKIERLAREIKFFDEFKVCYDLIKLIRAEKPSVIHLNSSKIGGIGAVAGRIASYFEKDYRPKIIFTSHGWGFYEKHRPFLIRIFFYLSHWVTLLLCHETIAVSEKTKKDIAFLPFMKGKIRVVHNGIDKFETLEKGEARKALGTEDLNKIVIFSLSELHKNKGVDVAILGISLLTEDIREKILYTVAGKGEEKENLENMIRDLKLENSVRLLDYVEDARKLLSGADIFLLPSRTENLPFAVLEAGYVGVSIIATSVGGVPEIITDMKNGILVHRESPNEIKEAIKYLIENPERQKEFSVSIRKVISKNFSRTKMIKETVATYN